MNVVIYCISPKLSGGELYTLDLASALVGLDHNVSIASTPDSLVFREAQRRGIEVVETNVGPKLSRATALRCLRTFPVLARRLARELRGYDRSTIVILQYKLEQLLFGVLRVNSPRVAILEHGPIPAGIRKSTFLNALYDRAISKSVAVLVASEPAAAEFDGETTRVLAGIDKTRLRSVLGSTPRPRAEARPEQVEYLFAGRLTKEKGIDLCIEFARTTSTATLLVAGDGPLRDNVVKQSSVLSNIHYLGVVPDALKFAAVSDFALLLTSDHGEGRPLFALECLAVGTPVIALRSNDAMRALQTEFGEEAVRLIERGDPDEIVQVSSPRVRVRVDVPSWADAAQSLIAALEGGRA